MTLLDIDEDFNMLKADLTENFELLRQDVKEYIEGTKLDLSEDGCKCPFCNSYNNYKIVDSRLRYNRGRVRRKICNVCKRKWNTVEVLERKIGYGKKKTRY